MNTDQHLEEQQDDAIIGTAFKWSAVVLGLVATCAVAAVWLLNRPTDSEPVVIDKDTSQIESLDVAESQIPQLQFTDVTATAGIEFVHSNGATGEKLLPETMGGGVAFFDFNSDGNQDLLLIDSKPWPDTPQPDQHLGSRLYQGDGAGQFTDVTDDCGLKSLASVYGLGCAVGDYDNDGDPDLFIAALGTNRLLRNDNGTFTDVTEEAGTAGADNAWSTSCGFFDYDRDGDLDLFVCNYVQWSCEIDFELNYSLNGSELAYGPPTNYQGEFPYLYRNDGEGGFTEVARAAGIHVLNEDTQSPVAKSLAVILVDIDRDGYDDIVVANDTVQNHLFHNNGDGTFAEMGALTGIAFDRSGQATGAMGIDAGFPLSDDTMAISIGNFANEMTSFYMTQGDALVFADQSLMEGIGAPSRARLTFGLMFVDVDLDGRQELVQTNGHLEDEINQIQPSQTYRQPAQLFWNQGAAGDGCYAIVPDEKVGDLTKPIVGRGAAYADIDNDGDLDVVLTQVAGPPLLLRNDNATGHHWLRIRLQGTTSNRDGLGARVTAIVNNKSLQRFVSPTKSYLSQVELPVTFGLGDAEQVDQLTIHWPSGKTQHLANIPANQTLVVVEE